MTANDLLAESVLANKQLLGRFLAGFDDGMRVRTAPSLPNHAAWNLGHCALVMSRVTERLDGKPLPDAEFIVGPKGDSQRFGTESVAFGSTPTSDHTTYPAFARCVQIFESACDRLAAAARAATPAQLDSTTQWGNSQTTLAMLVLRMSFHNGMHAGQISDLRRALGFKSVLA